MFKNFLILTASILLLPVAARAQVPESVAQAQANISAAPATQPASASGIIDLSQQRFSSMKVEDIWNLNFWTGYIQDAIAWFIGFIPRLLVAVFLLFFFWLVYRAIRKVILGGMKAAGVDDSIRDMMGMLLKWFVLGFGLIIAGNQVGIQIAALLTGVSIIGLAIGFAAQDSISNFIAGIMIFWDKPFKVGDWIQIDGHLGQVKRVTFRSTRLQDLDGDIVILPNTKMLNDKVINKSSNSITRCNVLIGIAYNEWIEKARKVLLDMVHTDPRIEKAPEPEVVVRHLNASSVDLGVHFWIREEKYEDAMQYEYMEKCKVALDAAGIEIPFPHVQVLMEQPPTIGALVSRAA